MSGRWAIKNETLRRIALEARDVMPRERVTFTWVPREKTKAADALANESMDAVERGRSGTIRRAVADAYETEVEADPVPPGPRPAIVGWGPDIGAPTVTVIVRHGVTQHSLERRFSGSGGPFDPPLVEQGVAQAEAAAVEVERRGAFARHAAHPADGRGDRPAHRCRGRRRTRSRGGAVREGTATFAEVMSGWPDEMAAWLASPDVAPPGGESLHEVAARVGSALERVLAEHSGKRILLVAHVGTIRALTARALDTPASSMNRMELAPASITTLTWYADGNASMRSFAESSHLEALGTTWTP
jgi:probable phosphoglycerate mutase